MKRNFVLFTIALGILAVPSLADLYDDFESDTVDSSRWITLEETLDVSVTQNRGSLLCTLSSAAHGESFGCSVISQYKFSGNFDIQVDFSLTSWPLANGVRTGLNILSTETGANLVIERVATSPKKKHEEGYLLDGANTLIRGETSSSDMTGKLRLVRVDNIITGYIYGSNSQWQAIASYTNEEVGLTSDQMLSVALCAWSHDIYFNPSNQDVTVAFDNILLTADNIVPEPATISLLAFGGLVFFRKGRV